MGLTQKLLRFSANNRHYYSMPENYQNSFYNANSQLFDSVNYFLHYSYEIVFKNLVEELIKRTKMRENLAKKSILNSITCLEHCNDFLDVHIPVKMNNGLYKVVRGFRAHHGLYYNKKSCLGGFRMCVDLERDHVKALATLSTYKHACLGLNLGGAHGGLKMCKSDFNKDEIREIIESYAKEMGKQTVLNQIDLYEPDMYCKLEEMSWFQEALSKTKHQNLFIVGTPDNSNKLKDYDSILGESPYLILNYLLNEPKIIRDFGFKPGLKDKTFICDGLGKMGASVAKCLEEAGARCVGFKEIGCFLYEPDGFSVNELLEFKNNNGSFKGYTDKITNTDSSLVLSKPCDLLVLTSSHKMLNCYVADSVQAQIVLECSSASITPIAHKILTGKKILVVPDILATCGMSLACYFEYKKHFEGISERHLIDVIDKAFVKRKMYLKNKGVVTEHVFDYSSIPTILEYVLYDLAVHILEIDQRYKLKYDLRTATYIYSIKKLFEGVFESKMN